MSGEHLSIRPATEADLPAIAAVHLQAYSKDHFTSRLPSNVLVDYYRLFLDDGSEILVISEAAIDGSEYAIIGFAVFGHNISKKLVRFRRDRLVDILQASLRHPLAAGGKLARQLITRATSASTIIPANYLLLSIAVSKSGTGAGSRLLDALLEKAVAKKVERVGLYVNSVNISAINAYVRKDFIFREIIGGQYYMERHP